MSSALLVAWAVLVVRVAVATRPVVPRDVPEAVVAPLPAARGAAMRGVRSLRWAAVGTAGAVVGVVVSWSPVAAVAGVGATLGLRWWWRRRAGRRRHARIDRHLVLLVQVLDLAVGAGATVRLGLAAAAPRLGHEVGRAVGRAVRRIEAGAGMSDALDQLSAELDGRDRGVLVRVATAEASGAPVGAVLGRAGRDLAEAERHRAALRARRLPVLLLVPLVACILPAFVVLAIVPMVASGAGSLFPL